MTKNLSLSLFLLISTYHLHLCCGEFQFDVHHRFSDRVRGVFDFVKLPEVGSVEYYSALVRRDLLFRGRRLSTGGGGDGDLTFAAGNETVGIQSLGFLQYANVSVGTPSKWFLVALDTGSDLFWLPCDCNSCVEGLRTTSGQTIDFNIYSPNTSSTSMDVTCSSSSCQLQSQCSATTDICPYEIIYLSNGTSSSGILIEDVLHLVTDDSQSKVVDAQVKFGCGMTQTGSFLDGAAPNGLFGLGLENVSVPSMLASEGLAANSFSMCFGPDGTGRINFGDRGSSDQGKTPLNINSQHPTYNISITQLSVGRNVTSVGFSAIFDSGTSFTYLNDPVYTFISKSFDSQTKDERVQAEAGVPFEYCYITSATESSVDTPPVTLTMKGGNQFNVTVPTIRVSAQVHGYTYCLGIVRSDDVNIIGQNFMTGYLVVFDREKLVLGWKASDCYGSTESSTLPVNPRNSTAAPPTASLEPEAATGNRNGSPTSSVPQSPPSRSHSHLLKTSYMHFVLVFSLLTHFSVRLAH